MAKHLLAIAAAAALAFSASAATLTITPDAITYQVGDTITLSVFGDPEGESDRSIFGRLLFDPNGATYVSSTQQPLTTSFGNFPWALSSLDGGVGFADAFNQITSDSGETSTVPLIATVIIEATGAGALGIEWDITGDPSLDFFSVSEAPGASVFIVPEPSTALLLALGMVAAAVSLRRGCRLGILVALLSLTVVPQGAVAFDTCVEFVSG